ncbi:hypothetical protein SteCoe_27901 [Stentor coeruleus]|uniref:Uncharacterized protein n=1 Tax=Stentor coeruleus TaxID=5963 RepID=A0A1R2BA00_9CILI|nr:hypothetical protein SteCoe_27901 [Stentor coeruleus]
MDSFKCFIQSCQEPAEILCSCSFPLIPICSNHIKDHTSDAVFNRHSFRSISQSQNLCLNKQTLLINDSNFPNSTLHVSPGTGSLSLLKKEVYQIPIPKDYESAFQDMITTFAKKVVNTQRDASESISQEFMKFYNSCQKIIPNLILDLGTIANDIIKIFNDMQSFIESETNSLLKNLISSLIDDNLMKKVAGLLTTTCLKDVVNDFFTEIMLKSFNCQSVLSSFTKHFSKFLISTDSLPKYFSDFENIYWMTYQDTIDNYNYKISNYLNTFFKSITYQHVGIYKLFTSFDYKNQLVSENNISIVPDWIMVYNVLLSYEKIIMSNPIEVAPNEILVLLCFKNSSQSFLLFISEFTTYQLKTFKTADLIIASGSCYNQVIVVKTLGNKVKSYFIFEKKLIPMNSFRLSLPKFSVTSAAVAENSLICTLNTGRIYVYNIGKKKCIEEMKISLHEKDNALSIKYRVRQRILMLRTLEYVYFYNCHFQEIFKVQSLKKDVEISDNEGTGLCFYCFSKGNLMVWTYDLTAEDREKLGFNPKKLWKRQNVSLWKKLFINIISHDTLPIDAYSQQANKIFLPIVIYNTELKNEDSIILDKNCDKDKEIKFVNEVCPISEVVEKYIGNKNINGYEEVSEERK